MVTGYVLRFIKNVREKMQNNPQNVIDDVILTTDEYKNALDLWIKREQNIMKSRNDFVKLQPSLNLFEDKCRMLRMKGRFNNVSLHYQEKCPLILRSGESYFTKLILLDSHERVLHHGVESSLNYIRSRFWIIKGRKTVKNILRACVTCKRYQARTMVPLLFLICRIVELVIHIHFKLQDLTFAKNLRDANSKVYILIHTCASTRAIHLELTPNMNTFSFLRAFKRFTSRRGIPDRIASHHIVHDNFKTFKSEEVKHFMVRQRIEQKPILPAALWWGGFYERLVKSVKLTLEKVLG